MRKTICLVLTWLMAMPLTPVALAGNGVSEQIAAIPAGAKVEIHLKNKQELRGTKGAVSNSGFTLVGAGKAEQQVAFDDVASVKQVKSHTMRNILLVAGIGVAALAITIGILLRCGPFGCGKMAI